MELINTLHSESKIGEVIFEMKSLDELKGKDKISYQRSVIIHKIESIFNQKTELGHLECGAPIFKGLEHLSISISHSPPFFGIQIREEASGIDVQKIKVDIDKGRRFFVMEEEENLISSHIDTNIIWSAKEALYKSVLGDVVDYKRSIQVLSFTDENLIGKVNGKRVECKLFKHHDFVSVFLV